jgi:hypothetical protein
MMRLNVQWRHFELFKIVSALEIFFAIGLGIPPIDKGGVRILGSDALNHGLVVSLLGTLVGLQFRFRRQRGESIALVPPALLFEKLSVIDLPLFQRFLFGGPNGRQEGFQTRRVGEISTFR